MLISPTIIADGYIEINYSTPYVVERAVKKGKCKSYLTPKEFVEQNFCYEFVSISPKPKSKLIYICEDEEGSVWAKKAYAYFKIKKGCDP